MSDDLREARRRRIEADMETAAPQRNVERVGMAACQFGQESAEFVVAIEDGRVVIVSVPGIEQSQMLPCDDDPSMSPADAVRLGKALVRAGRRAGTVTRPAGGHLATVDHLTEAFDKATALFDDFHLREPASSEVSLRLARIRENIVHAIDQRVMERVTGEYHPRRR